MNNNDFYIQKQRNRLLSNASEYTTGKVAYQISMAFGLALIIFAYDVVSGTFGTTMVAVGCVYILMGIIQWLVCKKIVKDIIHSGEIKSGTRKLGYLLLPFIFTGNFFITITGFMLIKKDKSIEYLLAVYTTLVTLFVIIISLTNVFKPYVADLFNIGLVLLIFILLVNIFALVFIGVNIKTTNVALLEKKFIPVAIVSILTGCTGNVFGIILGLMILAKVFRKDADVSIEWIDVIRRLFRNYLSVIGLFFVIFLLTISIMSYLTFDYDMATVNNYQALLQSPSLMYPFGTDEYGRCVFSRIVFGARISLLVGLVTTLIPGVIGGALGAYSGYYGNRIDNVIMRLLDILYAVPGVLLAIAIIAAFGSSTMNLVIALSIGGIPSYARTIRATVLSLTGQEFVEAARACGAKDSAIIFKHIVPNSLAPMIVRGTLSIGSAVLATSSLSYLGLGVESYIPEWGNILQSGSTYLETNPYIAIFPGIAIVLIVLAFNYFGDGLRDALDPKLK